MRRVVIFLAASLLAGCPPNEIVGSHVETRDASVPPAADHTFAAMVVDPTGRWVASPSASSGLHRLALLDMTTRSFRSFDAVRGARSVAFWDASRGSGIDALTVTTLGDQRMASLVSLSLADGRTVLKKEIGPLGTEEPARVVRSNDVLFVATSSLLTAYDGATGAVRGAFTARPGTFLSVTPVPAARRIVVTTTRGAAILREEDASLVCVAAPVVDDPKHYNRVVETAVVGKRAFLGIPLPAAASHHAVVDVEACAYEGAVQGGPVPVVAGGTVASILDRYAGSPDATGLPEAVTKSPVRYHLVLTDAATREQSYVALDETPSSLVGTPNGARLITIDAAGVRIVDVATREVRAVAIAKPTYLAVSADSRHLFLGTSAHVMVLDLASGTTTPIELPSSTELHAVAPSRFDGLVVEQKAGTLTLFERASGTRVDLPRPTVSP